MHRDDGRAAGNKGGGIVTSSAFEIPWETSWHNQNTGVYKGSIEYIYMCKGKVFPLQARCGPEGG